MFNYFFIETLSILLDGAFYFFADESPASCNLNTTKRFHGDLLKKNGLIKTGGVFLQIAGKAGRR